MRIYEELFIIRPDAIDEVVDPLVEQLKGVVTQAGGTIDKTEKWGVRKLAYRVQKHNEGQYILIQFSAEPSTVKEVERRLRVADVVLKYMTVRIDEKLKRIEKRKKAREKRAARKPAVVPSLPSIATPLQPAEPGGPMPGAPVAASTVPPPPAPGSAQPVPADVAE